MVYLKNQSKTYKKVVQSYLKEVKAALVCSRSMKQALISSLKLSISELSSDPSTLSAEELYKEIGTPEEIARSLESRSDIESLKRKAKRYTVSKILCALFLALAALALLTIVALLIVILTDQDYTITTVIR